MRQRSLTCHCSGNWKQRQNEEETKGILWEGWLQRGGAWRWRYCWSYHLQRKSMQRQLDERTSYKFLGNFAWTLVQLRTNFNATLNELQCNFERSSGQLRTTFGATLLELKTHFVQTSIPLRANFVRSMSEVREERSSYGNIIFAATVGTGT